MAFFGSDGLEHQVKHLKQQLSNKDIEITSVRNELRKKDEELVELKRQRESINYKLQEEEGRAHKAETALKQRTQELSTLRLQHDNLQASLNNANDKIRVGEKENKGLQYDVEALGSTSNDAKTIQKERDSLQIEVKELKRKLCRIEEEKAESAIPIHKNQLRKSPTTDFFGQSISPPKRGNRRRSTSLSSDNRVSELEAEIEMLRSNQGPSSIEMDKIKTQLSNAKKELDKATNAKLAFERSAEREKQDLQSRLDDAQFELDDWRRNDGSAGKGEIEKIKKAAKAEMDNVAAKVRALEIEVEEKGRIVERLERELSGMDDLRAELEAARSAQISATSTSSLSVAELQAKLTSVEEELVQARASTSSTAGSAGTVADKTIRQLKREVKTLSATITSLQEECAAQDEQINRLQTAVPLPGSPVLSPSTNEADITRIAELEEDLEEARAEILELKDKLEVSDEKMQVLQNQLADVNAKKAEVDRDLKTAQEELGSTNSRVMELEAEITLSRTNSSDQQQELDSARQAADTAQRTLQDVQSRLDDLARQHAEVSSQLGSRSFEDSEVSAIRASLEAKEQAVAELEGAVQAARAKAVEVEAGVADIVSERDANIAEVQSLHEDVLSLRDRLVDAEDRLKTAVSDRKAAMKNAKEKHREAIAEAESLRLQLEDAQSALSEAQRRTDGMQESLEETLKDKFVIENTLNELRAEIANRATDSEARQRDEELFDQKEAVERLQQVLDTERAEHAKEIEAAAFILSKDLEESRKRVANLEKEIDRASSNAKHLKLAEDKIHRLRAERDELRISLHFVNHEQRFTSKEVESHRLALNTAREDFDKQTNSLADLQRQYDESNERSGEISTQLQHDLTQATAARDALSQQISELEVELEARLADCREQEAQSGALASDRALAKSQAERANAEVAGLRRANRDLEVRHDRLQALLEAKMETDSRRQAEEASAIPERPGSIDGRRVRRISGLSSAPSPASDQLEKLKVAHADTVGRLKRRDATIRDLENRLRQKETNLGLADEASSENLERAEKLEHELRVASAEVENLRKELANIESALRNAESDSQVHARSLEQVIVALAAEHHSARQNARLWTKRVELLGESDVAMDRIASMASATVEHAKSQIASLSKQATAFKIRIAETQSQLDKSHSAELELQQQLQQQLESSRTTESTLQQQLEGLQQKLDETSTKLTELEQTNAALLPVNERVAVLQYELDASREEVSMRQIDIAELLNKLANAEKSRSTNEGDTEALAQTMAELSQAQDQVVSLKQEQDTLMGELADLQKIQDEMTAEHQSVVDVAAQKHSEEITELRATIETLQIDMQEKLVASEQARDNAAELEAQLSVQNQKVAELETTSHSDRVTIDGLQAKIAELEGQTTRLDELTAALANDQITIEQLNGKIAELEASFDRLRDERDTLSARVHQLDTDLTIAQRNQSALANLQTKMADLEIASGLVREERDSLFAQVNRLETELASAGQDEQTQASEMLSKIAELESNGTTLEKERNTLSIELDRLHIKLSTAQSKEEALTKDIEASEDKIAALERNLSEAVALLQTARQGVADAQQSSSLLQQEVIALREENAELGRQVEEAKSHPILASNNNAEELQERVTELEASLTLKVQEVDEADDRVREAYKEKSKLEKKVAKLQRQLAASSKDAETAANTAANKNLTLASVAPMAPPSIAAPRQATVSSTPRSAAVPPSPRQPLRPVNVFEPKPSPSAGLKRAREEKMDEKPLPAECILLPPTQLDSARAFKSAPKTVFSGFRPKPQGGNVFDIQQTTPRINVFSENNIRDA